MNDYDFSPHVASNVLADLKLSSPVASYDFDDVGKKHTILARRKSAEMKWLNSCPPEMQKTDWERPELQSNAEQIRMILGHSPGKKGLICSGATGLGKTRAMWQLMRRLACEELRDIRYYQAHDFFYNLQSNINYGHDDARGWIEAVARREIVFIDDLGQEAITTARADWAQNWFFRFLDIRVGEGLPLYITTNLNSEQIAGQNPSHGLPKLRRLLDLCDPVSFK